MGYEREKKIEQKRAIENAIQNVANIGQPIEGEKAEQELEAKPTEKRPIEVEN